MIRFKFDAEQYNNRGFGLAVGLKEKTSELFVMFIFWKWGGEFRVLFGKRHP